MTSRPETAGPWNGVLTAVGVAALLGIGRAAPVTAQVVTPATFTTGSVTFAMHSTIVGAFTGQAPIARAEFIGGRLSDVRGAAEVQVADMRTGNATRDRHMRAAMEADSFPTIRFELDSIQTGLSTGDTVAVVLLGRLILHGFTRPVRATGSVVLAPGGEQVEAAFPVDMREYRIRPPVRALVLRVAPAVAVSVHLSFAAGSSP